MPVNHDLRLIFIHIPKTAGTSIEYSLGMHSEQHNIGLGEKTFTKKNKSTLFGGELQHLNAHRVQKILGRKTFDSYFKFSIVRNPFDRLVSYLSWIYYQKGNQDDFTPEIFEKQIWHFRKKKLQNRVRIPVAQYKYLFKKNHLLVDSVFKFERLQAEIEKENRIKLLHKLEHRMKSDHLPYQEYYTSSSISFVTGYYKMDFLYFGYDNRL